MPGLEVEGHGDDGEQVASEDGRPREGSQDVFREDHRDKEESAKEEDEEENQAEAVVRVFLGQADQPGGDRPDREEDDAVSEREEHDHAERDRQGLRGSEPGSANERRSEDRWRVQRPASQDVESQKPHRDGGRPDRACCHRFSPEPRGLVAGVFARAHAFFDTLAFLIRPEARWASVAVSKPKTAEYLLPITCARKKFRLIPASAIARVAAYAWPARLSPCTSSAGIDVAARPAACAAAVAFLPETGQSSMAAVASSPGYR